MINVFQVHSGIPLLSLSLMKDECTNYVLWQNTSTWMDKNAKFVYRCDSDVIASVRKVSDGCKPRKQFSYFKSFFSEIKVSWGNYAEESYYHLEDLVLISFIKSHYDDSSKSKDRNIELHTSDTSYFFISGILFLFNQFFLYCLCLNLSFQGILFIIYNNY